MEVLVNGQSIDITFEGEQTVGEVVLQLLKWLHGGSMAVTGVTVDEEDFPLGQGSDISDRPLESVETIRVEAMSSGDLQVSVYATARDYFRILHTALTDNDNETYAQLAPEYEELRPSLSARFPEVLDSSDDAGIDLLRRHPAQLPTGEEKSRLAASVDRVSRLAESRLREETDPARELDNTSVVLSNMLPQLAEASVLLQSGKEQEAMTLIYQFSELASKLLRLLPKSSPATAEQVDTQQLHGALTELLQAFEAGDSVLIGDLIEYELVPKSEAILRQVTPSSAASSAAQENGSMG